MDFVSDEQRKAVFASMRERGYPIDNRKSSPSYSNSIEDEFRKLNGSMPEIMKKANVPNNIDPFNEPGKYLQYLKVHLKGRHLKSLRYQETELYKQIQDLQKQLMEVQAEIKPLEVDLQDETKKIEEYDTVKRSSTPIAKNPHIGRSEYYLRKLGIVEQNIPTTIDPVKGNSQCCLQEIKAQLKLLRASREKLQDKLTELRAQYSNFLVEFKKVLEVQRQLEDIDTEIEELEGQFTLILRLREVKTGD